MIQPVTFAEDRSMAVPAGHIVRTGYVAVEHVTMACRDRMAPGDVKVAYELLLQMGGNQPWPSPRGHWEGERFVVVDGRHQYVASLMLGLTHMLVAWVEVQADAQPTAQPEEAQASKGVGIDPQEQTGPRVWARA